MYVHIQTTVIVHSVHVMRMSCTLQVINGGRGEKRTIAVSPVTFSTVTVTIDRRDYVRSRAWRYAAARYHTEFCGSRLRSRFGVFRENAWT